MYGVVVVVSLYGGVGVFFLFDEVQVVCGDQYLFGFCFVVEVVELVEVINCFGKLQFGVCLLGVGQLNFVFWLVFDVGQQCWVKQFYGDVLCFGQCQQLFVGVVIGVGVGFYGYVVMFGGFEQEFVVVFGELCFVEVLQCVLNLFEKVGGVICYLCCCQQSYGCFRLCYFLVVLVFELFVSVVVYCYV